MKQNFTSATGRVYHGDLIQSFFSPVALETSAVVPMLAGKNGLHRCVMWCKSCTTEIQENSSDEGKL